MQVLITGASGFVGTALAQRLLADGQQVRALTRKPEQLTALKQAGAELAEGSLADPNQLAELADGAEVVFHCGLERCVRADAESLSWINVAGSENLVNAARHAGCRRLVMASCADVTLLDRDRLHWREEQAVSSLPLGASARSRLLAEELALGANGHGLQVTALRAAWVWGPGDTSRLPGLCREALAGGMRLYGAGDNLLSTLYIDNLVDALLAAAHAEQAPGKAIHVADTDMVTAREFFGLLSQALKTRAPRRGLAALHRLGAMGRAALGLPGALPVQVAERTRASLLDVQRSATDLDYRPRVSMDEGMSALAQWVTQQGGVEGLAKLERPAPETKAEAERMRALADSRS